MTKVEIGFVIAAGVFTLGLGLVLIPILRRAMKEK